PAVADPDLFELLTLAKTIHEETGGAHDVSAGALVKAWGFFRGSARVPLEIERREALDRGGMKNAVLAPQERTVRYLREGLEINLGSIGKGYALDRAARLLRGEGGIRSGLLHGGYSSVYAIGSAPGDSRGWGIALRHPWQLDKQLGVVRLKDR